MTKMNGVIVFPHLSISVSEMHDTDFDVPPTSVYPITEECDGFRAIDDMTGETFFGNTKEEVIAKIENTLELNPVVDDVGEFHFQPINDE